MPPNAAMIMMGLVSMLHIYPRLSPRLCNAFNTQRSIMTFHRFASFRRGDSSSSLYSLYSSSSSSEEEEIDISNLESSIDSCTNNLEISRILASYLIHNCTVKLVLAIAGGGSSSISALTATSGSSKVLMEGNLLYDRFSFAQYVSSSLHHHQTHLPNIIVQEGDSIKTFKFASSQSSFLLAYSALYPCLSFVSAISSSSSSSDHDSYKLQQLKDECIGVGCSSALFRIRRQDPDKTTRLGQEEFKSHAHITTWGADGTIFHYDVTLSNQLEEEEGGSTTTSIRRRNRFDEEQVIGNLILWSIVRQKNNWSHNKRKEESRIGESIIDTDMVLRKILNKPGDNLSMRQCHPYEDSSSQEHHGSTLSSPTFPSYSHEWKEIVEYAAHRIHRKEIDTALLIPSWEKDMDSHHDGMTNSEKSISHFSILGHTVLPQHTIIFPGSFNPLHAGHVALAHAAVDAIQTKMEQIESQDSHTISSSSSVQDTHGLMAKIWDAATTQKSRTKPSFSILFEMSLFNPDKPPIQSSEVVKRLESFITYLKNSESSSESQSNPALLSTLDWGVLLSSSPLFSEKVQLLNKYLLPPQTSKSHMRLIFVIGADTMVRIINPKYYNHSFENMLDAVRGMAKVGVHFVVGGRLEQSSQVELYRRYVTCEDELTSLPEDIQSLFTLLPTFRVDISSSELRARKRGDEWYER